MLSTKNYRFSWYIRLDNWFHSRIPGGFKPMCWYTDMRLGAGWRQGWMKK